MSTIRLSTQVHCIRTRHSPSQPDGRGTELAKKVDAIAQGADPSILIAKQDQLKAEQSVLADRFQTLQTELSTMPSAEATKAAAMLTRLELMKEHQGKDWRTLSHDEIQQFLIHLFGLPKRSSERGIFISKDENGRIVANFKGQVTFPHEIVDGRPTPNY